MLEKSTRDLYYPGKAWHVYILECSDHSLYTGISTNVDRRLKQHNACEASKCTRSRLPVELVYAEYIGSHSDALKREAAIKKLSRAEKLELIGGKTI